MPLKLIKTRVKVANWQNKAMSLAIALVVVDLITIALVNKLAIKIHCLGMRKLMMTSKNRLN